MYDRNFNVAPTPTSPHYTLIGLSSKPSGSDKNRGRDTTVTPALRLMMDNPKLVMDDRTPAYYDAMHEDVV